MTQPAAASDLDTAPQPGDAALLLRAALAAAGRHRMQRWRDDFDWARPVVERLRGAHAGLEQVFDQVYPSGP